MDPDWISSLKWYVLGWNDIQSVDKLSDWQFQKTLEEMRDLGKNSGQILGKIWAKLGSSTSKSLKLSKYSTEIFEFHKKIFTIRKVSEIPRLFL